MDTSRFVICALGFLSGVVHAQPPAAAGAADGLPPGPPQVSGWETTFEGGAVYQPETDLDKADGSFAVTRLTSEVGARYRFRFNRSVGISVGYDRDSYDFSNSPVNFWEGINTYRVSAPVFWGLDNDWTLYAIPSARIQGEDGADLGEALSGGGIFGFSYTFGRNLSIGPGFGVFTEIEDSASFFPILIVRWNIADKWLLETGRSLGASRGPGLQLKFMANDYWEFAVGGRFENNRFRLDENGPTPNGIGQDETFPLYFGAVYKVNENFTLTGIAGAEIGGRLQLDNANGTEIGSSNYDLAPFAGLILRLSM